MLSNILRVMVTIFSAFILVLSAETLLTENISSWGATSMTVSLLLLAITTTIAWRCRTSFFSVAAHLYSTVLVGRLFSTLRLPEDMVASGGSALDPLLLGETGPGVLYIMYLSYALIGLIVIQTVCLAFREENQLAAYSNKISLNDWALTFLRVYVGLMFIAHYSGHVLAGPNQFQVFSNYFSGVGFHIGGPMVVLAGVIEIAVASEKTDSLKNELKAINGLSCQIEVAEPNLPDVVSNLVLEITANDRAGIVQEVSSVIHHENGNLIKLVSTKDSAAYSGQDIFKAKVQIAIDETSVDHLISALEQIADDLMVDISR